MQATATVTTSQHDQSDHARMRALVRFNGLTFHSLATASFLETAVPLHVNRLTPVFSACPDVQLWLEQVWWPQRAELGRRLRERVEATWPEFDWNAAYDEFYGRYRPCSGLRDRRGGPALEALGLCATAAQAATFYRALAGSADEPLLRTLARDAARDHAAHFDYFRALFERCQRLERVGFAAAWRAAIAICRSARDDDVAAAFAPLDGNWNGAPIVPALTYPEFRERMAQLVLRRSAPGWIERLLFRPWLERDRAAPASQPARPQPWPLPAPLAA